MSDQSKTNDDTQMTLKELTESLVQLYTATLAIGDLDLERVARRLQYLNDVGGEEAPISMAQTSEHLAHMERLVALCRPIQDEMKRAPRRRTHEYRSFVA
jgi:hypothetical protein